MSGLSGAGAGAALGIPAAAAAVIGAPEASGIAAGEPASATGADSAPAAGDWAAFAGDGLAAGELPEPDAALTGETPAA